MYRQVGPVERRFKIRLRRGPAPAVLLGDIIKAKPFPLFTVKVCSDRQTGSICRIHKTPGKRIGMTKLFNSEGTAGAMISISTAVIIFCLFKPWQHFVVAPPGSAGFSPAVIVFPLSANVAHGIDRTAAPQGFPSGPEKFAVIQLTLRRGEISPANAVKTTEQRQSERHMDERIVIFTAGFQQTHSNRRIF